MASSPSHNLHNLNVTIYSFYDEQNFCTADAAFYRKITKRTNKKKTFHLADYTCKAITKVSKNALVSCCVKQHNLS